MTFGELHINIKVRILINFLQKLTQMTIFPFMTIYFSRHFGLNVAGILMILTIIVALLSSFYGGYLSDLIGRKIVLYEGEKFRFITMVIMALCNSPFFFSPTLTFVAFLLNNVLIGLITPANEAILMDVSTDKTRKMLYSINYWSINLSIAIGSLIGAIFYKGHFFELLIITAVTSIFCCILIQRFIIETRPINVKATKISLPKIFSSYKEVLRDRLFLVYLIAGIFMLGLEFQLINYISVKLSRDFQEFTLPFFEKTSVDGIEMLGVLRVENTALVVLLGALMLKLTNDLNEKLTLYIGSVLFTLGFVALALYNNFYILLIATCVFTIGELLYVPIHQALLVKIVDEQKRSQYIAVNSLRLRGAMLIGSLVVIFSAYFPSWTISVLYVLMGTTSIIAYSIIYSKLEQKEVLQEKIN